MPSGDARVLISFFVACFNEERNIYATLTTLTSALRNYDFAYEIIVVDDASQDGSVGEIRRFQADHPHSPVEIVARGKNLGLALNYVECAFAARGEWYRLVCGDNVESEETLRAAIDAIGDADMVITYPEQRKGFSQARNLISKTYTRLVNFITGHKIRYYNSPTIHRRSNVLRWHSRSRGFSFQADLIAQLLDHGASYVEIPVIATERTNGQSTALSLRNFLSVGHSLIEMAARRLRRRLFGEALRPAAPAKRAAQQSIGPLLLKVAMSLALLAFVAVVGDLPAAWNIMIEVSPVLFLVAVGAIAVQVVIGTARWWIILKLCGTNIDALRLGRINFVASFLGQVLPAGIGTDGVRVLLLRKQGVATVQALAGVLIDRAILLSVLLAACGLTFLLAIPDNVDAGVFEVLGSLFLASAPLPVAGLLSLGWLRKVSFVPRRIAELGAPVADPMRRMLAHPGHAASLLVLGLASYTNLALSAWLIARGLATDLTFAEMWLVLPPALLVASIPISLGGWGVRELTLVGGLVHFGVDAPTALGCSLLFGVAGALGTLPGLALWLSSGSKRDVPGAVTAA